MRSRPFTTGEPRASRLLLALGSATVLAGALFSTVASASPVRVELVYAAPEGCPTREEFALGLRSRVRELAELAADAGELRLIVQIERSAHDYAGRVTVRSASAESERTFSGSHCADVASSLSLIAALAVDSRVRSEPRAAPQTRVPRLDLPPRAREEHRYAAGVPPFRASVGLGSGALAGAAPLPLLFGAARVELEPAPSSGASPRLAAGVMAADSELLGPTSVAGEFRLLAAVLELCPLQIGKTGALTARPCTHAALGRMDAQGANVRAPERARSTWTAAGLSARVRLEHANPLYIELAASAALNLNRVDYVLRETGHVVYRTGWLSHGGELIMGFSFL